MSAVIKSLIRLLLLSKFLDAYAMKHYGNKIATGLNQFDMGSGWRDFVQHVRMRDKLIESTSPQEHESTRRLMTCDF